MINGIETYSTVLSCDSVHCSTDSVRWVLRTFGSIKVDVITAPGMDALLAGVSRPDGEAELARVLVEAARSAKERGSTQCLIMGHCNCRANRVPLEEHMGHLALAKKRVESWDLFRWVATGVFNPSWDFERVA